MTQNVGSFVKIDKWYNDKVKCYVSLIVVFTMGNWNLYVLHKIQGLKSVEL